MTFLKRLNFTALAALLLVVVVASCEKEPTTIGSGIVGGTPFTTDNAVFDVFAYNKKIEAVRTNKLPIYQLGTFSHPLYGKTEAMVTSQLLLPGINPTFGTYTQVQEDTENSAAAAQIPENEKIDSVYLYIPFLTSPTGDTDGDGLVDELDADPDDPNSDTDGDGLTDDQERTRGTDPLTADTDGDGVGDAEDDEFSANQFGRNFDLDSIYVNGKLAEKMTSALINLKVQRSNFFLRDLDPNTNFQEAQEYFSTQEFAPTFVDSVLFDSSVSGGLTISSEQIPVRMRDDASTEDVNEAEQFNFLAPGIRVALDNGFFQRNILDMEGGSELQSQANFNNFLRGIHFSLNSVSDDIMFLFDLKGANITISYSYDTADTAGVVTEGEGKRDFVINFIRQPLNQQGQPIGGVIGNAVNSYINDNLPPEVADNLDTGTNASNIYLQGGAGSYAEIRLFDDANGREAINQIKSENWIINEANLVFYVSDNSEVTEPPTLYLYNTETGAPVFGFPTSANEQLIKFLEYDGNLEESDDGNGRKYTVKITEHINNLVVRDAENAPLGLTITPSLAQTGVANAMLANMTEEDIPVAATISPLGTVLFGSEVTPGNADKKLKLEIFYTQTD